MNAVSSHSNYHAPSVLKKGLTKNFPVRGRLGSGTQKGDVPWSRPARSLMPRSSAKLPGIIAHGKLPPHAVGAFHHEASPRPRVHYKHPPVSRPSLAFGISKVRSLEWEGTNFEVIIG